MTPEFGILVVLGYPVPISSNRMFSGLNGIVKIGAQLLGVIKMSIVWWDREAK